MADEILNNTQDSVMDVASVDVTPEQSEQISNLAGAKQMYIDSTGTPQFYKKQRTVVRDYKVGRNDPCPCGSGKKYKNCCLSSGKYETTHEL